MARPGCPIDNDNPPKRIFIHFICPSSLFRQEQPRGQSTSTTSSNAEPDTFWSSSAAYIGLRQPVLQKAWASGANSPEGAAQGEGFRPLEECGNLLGSQRASL
ncbi:hypothetical protein V496_01186 [Pseudogymnoascus sp. VKM F-4515 (FW-2607)]|nr:hypothetical protein V496_01186 [Pseudogymnoascus sp. VKM F-4515 (FW-2607)]